MINKNAYNQLLDQLTQISEEEELRAAIEHNWHGIDYGFLISLWTQIPHRQEDPFITARLKTIDRLIHDVAARRKFEAEKVDEANLRDPYDVVLALAQQIDRGDLDFPAAVEQGHQMISGMEHHALRWVFLDLIVKVESSPLVNDLLTIGELIYRLCQYFPEAKELPPFGLLFNALILEIRKARGRGRFTEALRHCERMIEVARANDQHERHCTSLMTVGDIYQIHLGPPKHPDHFAKALHYYRRALVLCEDAGLSFELRGAILFELGKMLTKLGKPSEGAQTLEEALLVFRSVGSASAKVYSCLNALVDTCAAAGDYVTAIRHSEEASKLAPDLAARAVHLAELSWLRSYQAGETSQESLAAATRLADELASEPGGRQLRSSIYGTLGVHLSRTGDLQGALDAYSVALEEARTANNERGEARWKSNVAQIYMLLGQTEDAEALYEQAAQGHYRTSDHLGAANLLTNYGHVLFDRGDLVRAAESWARAYSLFHLEQRPVDMGVAAVALGQVFVEKKEWTSAEACFRYGLTKAEAANSLRYQLYAYGKLAELHVAQGLLDQAAESFVKAIEYAKQIGELSGEQILRVHYGRLLERLNRLDDAESEYRLAIELQDKIRGRFRSIERRTQFQRHTEDSTTNIVRLLARRKTEANAYSRAFAYADGARSRTLVELLSRRPVRQPATIPWELATREEELLRRVTGLETAAAVSKEGADQYLSLTGALEDLWNEIARIDESCRAYVDLRRTPFAQLKVITKLLVA